MDDMLNKILKLIGSRHGATKELAEFLRVHPSVITDWKSERSKSYPKYASQIAEYYGVSLDWLSGLSDEKEKPLTIGEELTDIALVRFPIIGTISAGNGCVAYEDYTGEYTYFAAEDLSAPPDEYFVLRVRGDSMYPKLLEGDCVLVRRKPCVDSGKIAVVIYNGDEATIKKVSYEQGESWVELVPINPEYKTRRIAGEGLDELRVLGEVIKLSRDL